MSAWTQIYKKKFIRVYWWHSGSFLLFYFYDILHISPLARIIKHLLIFVLKPGKCMDIFAILRSLCSKSSNRGR